MLPRGHEECGPRDAVQRRDARLRRALALVDVVATMLTLGLILRCIDHGRVHLLALDLVIIPFILLVGKVIGLYDRDQNVLRKTTIDEAPSIFYLAVVYALALWLCETALFRGYLARPQVLGLLAGTFVLVTLGRMAVRRIAHSVTASERCIVIGTASDAVRISRKFAAASSVNAAVVGRVSLIDVHEDAGARSGEVPLLGDYDRLARVVAENQVERVITVARRFGAPVFPPNATNRTRPVVRSTPA